MALKALSQGLQIGSSMFCLVLSFDSHKLLLGSENLILNTINLASVFYRVCFTYSCHSADLQEAFVLVSTGTQSGILNSQVSELMHQYCSLPLPTHLPTWIFWRRKLRLRQGQEPDQGHIGCYQRSRDSGPCCLFPRLILSTREFY